jgi:hypothetical protein
LTNKIIGQRSAREQKQHQDQYSALDHEVGYPAVIAYCVD